MDAEADGSSSAPQGIVAPTWPDPSRRARSTRAGPPPARRLAVIGVAVAGRRRSVSRRSARDRAGRGRPARRPRRPISPRPPRRPLASTGRASAPRPPARVASQRRVVRHRALGRRRRLATPVRPRPRPTPVPRSSGGSRSTLDRARTKLAIPGVSVDDPVPRRHELVRRVRPRRRRDEDAGHPGDRVRLREHEQDVHLGADPPARSTRASCRSTRPGRRACCPRACRSSVDPADHVGDAPRPHERSRRLLPEPEDRPALQRDPSRALDAGRRPPLRRQAALGAGQGVALLEHELPAPRADRGARDRQAARDAGPERLLEPLGLGATWYQAGEIGRRRRSPTATGSASTKPTARPTDLADGSGVAPFRSVVTAAGGAGSLAGTSADIAHWARALYGGDVLGPVGTGDPAQRLHEDPRYLPGVSVRVRRPGAVDRRASEPRPLRPAARLPGRRPPLPDRRADDRGPDEPEPGRSGHDRPLAPAALLSRRRVDRRLPSPPALASPSAPADPPRPRADRAARAAGRTKGPPGRVRTGDAPCPARRRLGSCSEGAACRSGSRSTPPAGSRSASSREPGTCATSLEAGESLRVEAVDLASPRRPPLRRAAEIVLPPTTSSSPSAEAAEDLPVHAQWHDIVLDVGPYRVARPAGDDAGLRPGPRPRPADRRVRPAPRRQRSASSARGRRRACREPMALVNRYVVDRVEADLMLGFFFPGAEMISTKTEEPIFITSTRLARRRRRAGRDDAATGSDADRSATPAAGRDGPRPPPRRRRPRQPLRRPSEPRRPPGTGRACGGGDGPAGCRSAARCPAGCPARRGAAAARPRGSGTKPVLDLSRGSPRGAVAGRPRSRSASSMRDEADRVARLRRPGPSARSGGCSPAGSTAARSSRRGAGPRCRARGPRRRSRRAPGSRRS